MPGAGVIPGAEVTAGDAAGLSVTGGVAVGPAVTKPSGESEEISINVPLPKETRAKDMDIKWDEKKLKVAIKGKEPIIDGELFGPIDSESLIWTIDEDKKGKNLVITFEKREQTWWESVVKGDKVKVDTGKISPEASSLSDIKDPELKAQVEKMMFDTRQKQMGKPTSDILQKCPQIEDFMKAHPEMDFSHAKFS